MKTSTVVAVVVAAIIGIMGIGWLFRANELAQTKVFAPANEQVRRETFEQSKAYTQGMIKDLSDKRFAYVQASPEHKAALASLILRDMADFDISLLPTDLRQFVEQLRRERGVSN